MALEVFQEFVEATVLKVTSATLVSKEQQDSRVQREHLEQKVLEAVGATRVHPAVWAVKVYRVHLETQAPLGYQVQLVPQAHLDHRVTPDIRDQLGCLDQWDLLGHREVLDWLEVRVRKVLLDHQALRGREVSQGLLDLLDLLVQQGLRVIRVTPDHLEMLARREHLDLKVLQEQ